VSWLDLGLLFDPRFDILPPRISSICRGFVRVTSLSGKQLVRIPIRMNGKLAYLIGVIIGDGYLSKPARRKSHGGGYYWRVVITGPRNYLIGLRRLFFEIFGLHGELVKDRRKMNTWQLRFANKILHRFLRRVIGLPQGRKTTHGSWSRFVIVKDFPVHFIAGMLHSDGYVGKHYIGIVQKRFRFLERLKKFANQRLKVHFRGPVVNRRNNGKTLAWIISIYNKRDRDSLIRRIARLGVYAVKSANR